MAARLNVDWNAMRREYLVGKVSCSQLATKYGVSPAAVSRKAQRQKWGRQRLALQEKSEAAATNAVIRTAVSKATEWAESQWSRCSKFRTAIDETLAMAGPVLDPQALDQLTKAEQRVDDMGRRSLGMVDAKAVDITSGGMPLGQFTEAMRSVENMLKGREGLSLQLDIEALAAEPITREASASTVPSSPSSASAA